MEARIIWIQSESLDQPNLPIHSNDSIEMVNQCHPPNEPLQQFLDLVLAVQWLTYSIGRVGAPDINTISRRL